MNLRKISSIEKALNASFELKAQKPFCSTLKENDKISQTTVFMGILLLQKMPTWISELLGVANQGVGSALPAKHFMKSQK